MGEERVHYDVIVLGLGTGGLKIASKCAHAGKKTLAFEPSAIGGTCLNTGCIPTKAMLYAAETYQQVKRAKEFGITAKGVNVNFSKVMNRVRSIVDEGQAHIKKALRKSPLKLIRKHAYFTSENTVSDGKKEYSADRFIIATGARNTIVPIKGLSDIDYLTNAKAIELTKMPKSIIMIGGGYIAMEFATFFQSIGVKVTVLELAPRVLGMLDEDVTDVLVEKYENMGMKICTHVAAQEVKNRANGVEVIAKDMNQDGKLRRFRAEKLFLAIGRRPNTEKLALRSAKVAVDRRGFVVVDKHLRTSNRNVYALGDVTGKAMFAHVAKRHVRALTNTLLHDKRTSVDHKLVPWSVFTHPPIAGVGISEKQSDAEKIGVLKAHFTRNGRAHILNETKGFVKVMYNKKNNRIVGCVIVGPRADDMIHEFVALLHAKGTVSMLRNMIHIHPTLSEVMEWV